MITVDTALQIARAYREIEVARELLKTIREGRDKFCAPDIRDAFGRPQRGLELGIPTSDTSRRCMNVEWELAEPIILAHIARQESILIALSAVAARELDLPRRVVSEEQA